MTARPTPTFDDRCGFNVQLQGLTKWMVDYLFHISAHRDHSHILFSINPTKTSLRDADIIPTEL
jgi:hypothetical protein